MNDTEYRVSFTDYAAGQLSDVFNYISFDLSSLKWQLIGPIGSRRN